MPRSKTSPWRYDRAAIRYVLDHDGLDAARARWPRDAVDPIARVLGLTKPYKNRHCGIAPDQIQQLGTKPDGVLAGEWGLPVSTVHRARVLLCIPCVERGYKMKAIRQRLAAIGDEELARPAHELGAELHVYPEHIAAERRRRNLRVKHRGASKIPPASERRRVAIRALRTEFPAITLEELGEVFGVTRERIRQIEDVMALEAHQ